MTGTGPARAASSRPAENGAASRVRRIFRPTLSDLIGIFLIVLVTVGGARKMFGDADAATHVATGLWILEHHEIPRTDPFSATFAGREWFAHEWLADIGMNLVFRVGGWPGVLAVSALLIAAAHLLLYQFLVRRGDDAMAAFGAVVAAAATASTHWLARPHLLTVLFLVVLVVVLEAVTSGQASARWLMVIPPLVLVWANTHGGFLVAFGVLACYGAGVLFTPRARSLLLPLAAAFAAAALAVLVNPWGWRLPRHLLAFFAARGEVLKATVEFAPASFDDRAGVTLLLFLSLGLAAAACGGRAAFRAGTILAFAMSTVMAFTSIRHVEVMVIFGAVVIADGFSALLRRKAGAEMIAQLESLRAREACSGGGLLAAMSVLVLGMVAAGGGLPEAGFDPAIFPVRMVRELKNAGVKPAGPVLTPDIWGGYLILEWPEARVFVDCRWDMRGDLFWSRYLAIYLARPGWERLLKEDGVNLALLPPDAPLAAAMRHGPGWRTWGADATTVVYERQPPPGDGG